MNKTPSSPLSCQLVAELESYPLTSSPWAYVGSGDLLCCDTPLTVFLAIAAPEEKRNECLVALNRFSFHTQFEGIHSLLQIFDEYEILKQGYNLILNPKNQGAHRNGIKKTPIVSDLSPVDGWPYLDRLSLRIEQDQFYEDFD